MLEDVRFRIGKNTKQAMDKAIQIGLFENQEEFVRKAISEKLEKIGIKLGDEKTIELTEMQRDVLREMANIGAGNASTALSEAIGREVKLSVSELDIKSLKRFSRITEAPNRLVIVVYASTGSKILGNVMLIFPVESAFSLVDLLQKRELGTTKRLSMNAQNILKQVGLSLLKCYLDAITSFLNIRIHLSDIRLVSTFVETIVDFVQMSMKEEIERVFVLKTGFCPIYA